jgi:hypothetical protein
MMCFADNSQTDMQIPSLNLTLNYSVPPERKIHISILDYIAARFGSAPFNNQTLSNEIFSVTSGAVGKVSEFPSLDNLYSVSQSSEELNSFVWTSTNALNHFNTAGVIDKEKRTYQLWKHFASEFQLLTNRLGVIASDPCQFSRLQFTSHDHYTHFRLTDWHEAIVPRHIGSCTIRLFVRLAMIPSTRLVSIKDL